jgi:hypothetical protein
MSYINITIIGVIVVLAGLFNGQMDHLTFHNSEYDPANTWRNKYAKDSEGNLIPETKSPWYYLGLYKPEYKEAFAFSSTALISLTDPWHRSKAICFGLWRLALVLSVAFLWRLSVVGWKNKLMYAGVYVALWIVQAAGFHLAYSIIY